MKVSVITPCNRPSDMPNVLRNFQSQDWPNKELWVMGDEPNNKYAGNVAKIGDNAYEFGCSPGVSIGEKRNLAIEFAHESEIICMMDSDDCYAPDYITRCMNHLIETGADTTGLSSLYFYEKGTHRAWEYTYNGTQPYVVGSGMCYYRRVWENNRFRNISEGEDAHFCANAGRVIPHNYKEGIIAMIHGNNTASHKQLKHMKPIDPVIVVGIMEKW